MIFGHFSLIFPHSHSHFLKYQSSSIWCAASMSPGRVARLDLHVMKAWWGKTSGYSAEEQQCTSGYQRAMPKRENREKSHRKKPTRPTVTHTQWLLHNSFGKITSLLSVLPCFCVLDLKSRCGFCFPLSLNLFICWSTVKVYAYWTPKMNSLCKQGRSISVFSAIFSRIGSHLCCQTLGKGLLMETRLEDSPHGHSFK